MKNAIYLFVIGICVGHVNTLFDTDPVGGLVIPATIVAVIITSRLEEDLFKGAGLLLSFWGGIGAVALGTYVGSGAFPAWSQSAAVQGAVIISALVVGILSFCVETTNTAEAMRRARKKRTEGFRSASERWGKDVLPAAKTIDFHPPFRSGTSARDEKQTVKPDLDSDTRAHSAHPTADGIEVEEVDLNSSEIPTLTEFVRVPN